MLPFGEESELEQSVKGLLAGAPGFEPGNVGTKNRCLTTWRRPNSRNVPAERGLIGRAAAKLNAWTGCVQSNLAACFPPRTVARLGA